MTDELSYAAWPNNTIITLSQVPWNNNYRDIVRFKSPEELNSYLDRPDRNPVTVRNSTYARVGEPVRLQVPFNTAYKYNYLRAHNPAQPIAGDTPRDFYYFITNVRNVSPGTTEFTLQLDVWQTFGFTVRFGNAYIERGHAGVANQNRFRSYGREYLTTPEGMDLGNEYEIAGLYQQELAGARGVEEYDILVTSTTALDQATGTVDRPERNMSHGSQMENLPNSAETYIFFSLSDYKHFLEVYSAFSWVTEGIISVQAIPRSTRYGISTTGKIVNGVHFNKVNNNTLRRRRNSLGPNWREKMEIPERYKHLEKFKVFPYTVVELTAYNGKPLAIKPEAWQDPSLTVIESPHFAQPSPRVMLYPFRYNAATRDNGAATVPEQYDDMGVINDGAEFLDFATGIYDFPSFTILNNGYISMMASQANTMVYQQQSADWSQQKALDGANVAYDQATASMGLANQLTDLGVGASMAQNNLTNQTIGTRAVKGAVTGALQASTPLGAIGAAANSLVNMTIDQNHNNQANAISTGLARATSNAQGANQAYNRDTNFDYAARAARGDYAMAIAGQQARIQDAKMIQPTVSGQVGGDAFNLSTYHMGYDIKIKRVAYGAMVMMGEFWLRYGYAINRFTRNIPEDLMVMSNFTYWKLSETYLTAAECPEGFKEVIRGIFETGVTVWADPDKIGNIDVADNEIKKGYEL